MSIQSVHTERNKLEAKTNSFDILLMKSAQPKRRSTTEVKWGIHKLLDRQGGLLL